MRLCDNNLLHQLFFVEIDDDIMRDDDITVTFEMVIDCVEL